MTTGIRTKIVAELKYAAETCDYFGYLFSIEVIYLPSGGEEEKPYDCIVFVKNNKEYCYIPSKNKWGVYGRDIKYKCYSFDDLLDKIEDNELNFAYLSAKH